MPLHHARPARTLAAPRATRTRLRGRRIKPSSANSLNPLLLPISIRMGKAMAVPCHPILPRSAQDVDMSMGACQTSPLASPNMVRVMLAHRPTLRRRRAKPTTLTSHRRTVGYQATRGPVRRYIKGHAIPQTRTITAGTISHRHQVEQVDGKRGLPSMQNEECNRITQTRRFSPRILADQCRRATSRHDSRVLR